MAFRFPPDVQHRLEGQRAYERKRKIEARAMSDQTLIATARYAMSQMSEAYRYSGGDCVYNGQFYHVLLPEIFRRLHAAADKEEIARRVYTEPSNDSQFANSPQ